MYIRPPERSMSVGSTIQSQPNSGQCFGIGTFKTPFRGRFRRSEPNPIPPRRRAVERPLPDRGMNLSAADAGDDIRGRLAVDPTAGQDLDPPGGSFDEFGNPISALQCR